MTLLSTLTLRVATWCDVLDKQGYELLGREEAEMDGDVGRLRLRAQRPTIYGSPSTTVDIRETWTKEDDFHGLMPTLNGHYLLRASWHAQIGSGSFVEAERLDIDLSKPGELIRHRHPYGALNHVREPTTISTPGAWIVHVEHIIVLVGYEDQQD